MLSVADYFLPIAPAQRLLLPCRKVPCFYLRYTTAGAGAAVCAMLVAPARYAPLHHAHSVPVLPPPPVWPPAMESHFCPVDSHSLSSPTPPLPSFLYLDLTKHQQQRLPTPPPPPTTTTNRTPPRHLISPSSSCLALSCLALPCPDAASHPLPNPLLSSSLPITEGLKSSHRAQYAVIAALPSLAGRPKPSTPRPIVLPPCLVRYGPVTASAHYALSKYLHHANYPAWR